MQGTFSLWKQQNLGEQDWLGLTSNIFQLAMCCQGTPPPVLAKTCSKIGDVRGAPTPAKGRVTIWSHGNTPDFWTTSTWCLNKTIPPNHMHHHGGQPTWFGLTFLCLAEHLPVSFSGALFYEIKITKKWCKYFELILVETKYQLIVINQGSMWRNAPRAERPTEVLVYELEPSLTAICYSQPEVSKH